MQAPVLFHVVPVFAAAQPVAATAAPDARKAAHRRSRADEAGAALHDSMLAEPSLRNKR